MKELTLVASLFLLLLASDDDDGGQSVGHSLVEGSQKKTDVCVMLMRFSRFLFFVNSGVVAAVRE